MPELIHEPHPAVTSDNHAIMVHDAQTKMDAQTLLAPVVEALRVSHASPHDAHFEILKALVCVYGSEELKRMIDHLK